MIRFYGPDVEAGAPLPEGESRHAVNVLRLRPGAEMHIVDGRGHAFTGRLVDANPRAAAVEIVSAVEEPPVWAPRRLTVAVAPTKNADRMEWLVEKLTEIGIDRFVPVMCEHSERRNLNRERLERVAVAAMKQSLKAVLPVIEPLKPLPEFLAEEGADGELRCVGYCDADTPRTPMASLLTPGASLRLLIGPEGDFSPAEIALARNCGFTPVTLGDSRLRTETAALYGAVAFHVLTT